MSADLQAPTNSVDSSDLVLEQIVTGSKKTSNYIVASALTIGGVGFSLASFST